MNYLAMSYDHRIIDGRSPARPGPMKDRSKTGAACCFDI